MCSFFDLDVHLSMGELTTDLHSKPINRNHYLHHTSSQPNYTKRSVVFQPAMTCSKLTIETLEQGMKYVQS